LIVNILIKIFINYFYTMPLKCYCTGSETVASLYQENSEAIATTFSTDSGKSVYHGRQKSQLRFGYVHGNCHTVSKLIDSGKLRCKARLANALGTILLKREDY
jgi:hypothetical protein